MPYRPDVERCDHNGLPAYRPVVIADGAFGPTTLRPSPDLRLSDRGEAMRVAREMAEAKEVCAMARDRITDPNPEPRTRKEDAMKINSPEYLRDLADIEDRAGNPAGAASLRRKAERAERMPAAVRREMDRFPEVSVTRREIDGIFGQPGHVEYVAECGPHRRMSSGLGTAKEGASLVRMVAELAGLGYGDHRGFHRKGALPAA